MARGSNPNSRKNLKSGKNATSFTAENAAEMQKKSTQSKRIYKSLTEDLKDRLTPERVTKMNERIIAMAEHGNIKAWERIRDTIGEKPTNKMELSGRVSDPSERFASFSDDELRAAIEALQKKSGQERG